MEFVRRSTNSGREVAELPGLITPSSVSSRFFSIIGNRETAGEIIPACRSAYSVKDDYYDPAPALRASKAPLLAILGELVTPDGVKANVRAITQIMDQAERRDYLDADNQSNV